MAKITLDTISSGFQSTSQVNNNNTEIAENLNSNVLYRDNPEGEPNEMRNLLDMNSNRIINLPQPLNPTEPIRLIDVGGIIDGLILVITTVEETVDLIDGQLAVSFLEVSTLGAAFYIGGFGADNGRLEIGEDLTVVSSSEVLLSNSYPLGTTLTLVRSEQTGGTDNFHKEGRVSSTGTLDYGVGATSEKLSTGVYKVTFTTEIGSTDYAPQLTISDTAGFINYQNQLSGSFEIETYDTSGVAADKAFSFRV